MLQPRKGWKRPGANQARITLVPETLHEEPEIPQEEAEPEQEEPQEAEHPGKDVQEVPEEPDEENQSQEEDTLQKKKLSQMM